MSNFFTWPILFHLLFVSSSQTSNLFVSNIISNSNIFNNSNIISNSNIFNNSNIISKSNVINSIINNSNIFNNINIMGNSNIFNNSNIISKSNIISNINIICKSSSNSKSLEVDISNVLERLLQNFWLYLISRSCNFLNIFQEFLNSSITLFICLFEDQRGENTFAQS